eukprot:scaffold50461_cov55-Phaeocystis_antarctica.AAC.1
MRRCSPEPRHDRVNSCTACIAVLHLVPREALRWKPPGRVSLNCVLRLHIEHEYKSFVYGAHKVYFLHRARYGRKKSYGARGPTCGPTRHGGGARARGGAVPR